MTGPERSGGAAPGGGAAPHATLVTAPAGEALTWRPLDPYDGVDYKLLWRSGSSVAGIMRIAPTGMVTPHAHDNAQHHMWVIDGSVEMLHEVVGPGTYAHIPAKMDHSLRAVGGGPATVLYLYLRDEPGTGATTD
jgi:mannose-6-phosphate isomerase-like protein (cupin superfamily)